MGKIQSNFKNILLCLLIISTLMAGILGAVYTYTKKPIAKTAELNKKSAIEKVIPSFDELKEAKFPVEMVVEDNIFKKAQAADSLVMYDGYKNGEWVGTAVETFTDKGFSGRIKLMVGFLSNGNINKIEVLEHKETPGLGSKMEIGKSKFPDQFLGKNPSDYKLSVTKDGGDVDAITAATISSRAYCDAVQTAYDAFTKNGGKINE